MARKTLLTPELIVEVCDTIRQGAYDYIAAERVGISQATFYGWLVDAAKADADPLKVEFLESVTRAKAEARANAEVAVMKEKPELWLLKGPGKHKPDREGWSNENVLTLQQGTGPIKLTWGDDDGSTTSEIAQIATSDQE